MPFDWFSLGKKRRSRFGRYLDHLGITQSELQRKAKVSQGTISKLCNDEDYVPKISTVTKIRKALKQLGKDMPDDYFGM